MSRRKNDPAAAELSGEVTVGAVICAAGASRRLGGIKKEYRPLPSAEGVPSTEGLTVLGAAVSAFAAVSNITTIVITVPADPENGEAAARKALPPRLFTGKTGIHFVTGGATRRASVFNALSLFSAFPPDFVLIHDGARPWVSVSLIRRIIAEVMRHHAVIPLMPLVETPKETEAPLSVNGDAVFIKQHLRRAAVGTAQTPQGFAFPGILAAHEQAAAHIAAREAALPASDTEYTDDAEIWASFCGPVAAIPGESQNRKITFAEDFL